MSGQKVLTGFHRRKAVAPLKVLDTLHDTAFRIWIRFPSPKGGGPIEGSYISSESLVASRSDRFRSPKGGGPIEGTVRRSFRRS